MKYLKLSLLFLVISSIAQAPMPGQKGAAPQQIPLTGFFLWFMDSNDKAVLDFDFSTIIIPGTTETLLSRIAPYAGKTNIGIDIKVKNISPNQYQFTVGALAMADGTYPLNQVVITIPASGNLNKVYAADYYYKVKKQSSDIQIENSSSFHLAGSIDTQGNVTLQKIN